MLALLFLGAVTVATGDHPALGEIADPTLSGNAEAHSHLGTGGNAEAVDPVLLDAEKREPAKVEPISLGQSDGQAETGMKNGNRRRRRYSSSEHGGCPDGEKGNWIKWVVAGTKSRDIVHFDEQFSGRNAPSSVQDVRIYQLAVSTVSDHNAKGLDYGDEFSKGEYPGTAAAMMLQNDVLKKYNEGGFTHSKDKNINNSLRLGRGSLTRDIWWKLGTNCYAMASYAEIKQDSDNEFKQSGGSSFAKAVNLRVAKLSVCKDIECEEQKLVMDCWVQSTSGDWEQCFHWPDKTFIAAALARA